MGSVTASKQREVAQLVALPILALVVDVCGAKQLDIRVVVDHLEAAAEQPVKNDPQLVQRPKVVSGPVALRIILVLQP